MLEDDYDGELRYDVGPLPLLGALGPDVVVHLGTSSKIISPTLGVGWLVAPPGLRAEIVTRRTATGARPARAGQRVFTALADSGDLARHLRRLRRELAGRRSEVLAAVADGGGSAEGDAAGAHVVVPLADTDTEEAVVTAAAADGVAIDGLGRHWTTAGRHRPAGGLVVGFAAPARAELARALPILARVLREVAGPPRARNAERPASPWGETGR